MALCEQGYLCEVCGEEVETIDESDLYLRFVLGEVDPETLHVSRERHIRCNPTLAQFIVAEGFEPVVATGFFAKSALDPEFVAEEEARITEGYLRLLELPEVVQEQVEQGVMSPTSAYEVSKLDDPAEHRPRRARVRSARAGQSRRRWRAGRCRRAH